MRSVAVTAASGYRWPVIGRSRPHILLLPMRGARGPAQSLQRLLSDESRVTVTLGDSWYLDMLATDGLRRHAITLTAIVLPEHDRYGHNVLLPTEVFQLGQTMAHSGDAVVLLGSHEALWQLPFPPSQSIIIAEGQGSDLGAVSDGLTYRALRQHGPVGFGRLATHHRLVLPVAILVVLTLALAPRLLAPSFSADPSNLVLLSLLGYVVVAQLLALPARLSARKLDDLEKVLVAKLDELRLETPGIVAATAAFSEPLGAVRFRSRGQATRTSMELASSSTQVPTDLGPWMQELAHALNTPLAQIMAAALNVQRSALLASDDRQSLERILGSVKMCNTFMRAYAGVAAVGGTGDDPGSLQAALESAAVMYRMKTGRTGDVRIDVPAQLPPHTNAFVFAVTVPLIENALEASDEPVTVRVMQGRDHHRIQVSNRLAQAPSFGRLRRPKYTSKGGPHQGLGLSMVARLLESQPGCCLDHRWVDGVVTFEVVLARR